MFFMKISIVLMALETAFLVLNLTPLFLIWLLQVGLDAKKADTDNETIVDSCQKNPITKKFSSSL